eukprot:s6148_g1.t1
MGDQSPIPEEWKQEEPEEIDPQPTEETVEEAEMDQEEEEEEAKWRAKAEATPGVAVPDGSKDEEEEVDGFKEEYDEVEEEPHTEAEPHDEEQADDADMGDDHTGADHKGEYADMSQDMERLKDFVKEENSKKRKTPDGEGDEGQHGDPNAGNRNRNKGNYKSGGKGWGNWGNKGGKGSKGWGNGWWPKGKGKGGKWNKWQNSWHDDYWQPRGVPSSHAGGHGGVLRADNKGGFYLPHHQGYIDANMQPGDAGKHRIRGGAKAQQAKQNQKIQQERRAQEEHSRSLTMKLANITEKALDKLPS